MRQEKSALSLDEVLEAETPDTRRLHKEAARITRRKLLRAASECFADKGYHSTTIREIASRAGVTLGALYHHFKDKKALLIWLNRARQVKSWEILRNAMAEEEDFFTALRRGLGNQFTFLAENPTLRGITREYFGMAMLDPDFNQMHNRNDMEFYETFAHELERRYPALRPESRDALIRMLVVALEGLMIDVVVESPMADEPDQILNTFIDAFEVAVKRGNAKGNMA
jgi:AcrR family transcriptional regulator